MVSLFARNRVLVGTLAVALMLLVPTSAFAAKPGNSLNAKNCYKGGWTAMAQADGTPFASQDACTAYGAHGGTYPRVFAVAFTNIDGVGGFNPATDVLIADLVDTNGSNTVNAGDMIHMGGYPLTVAGTTFGTFGVTSHTVTGVEDHPPVDVWVTGAGTDHFYWQQSTVAEGYAEGSGGFEQTYFYDQFSSGCDFEWVNSVRISPSVPSDAVALDPICPFGYQRFIDVTLNLP